MHVLFKLLRIHSEVTGNERDTVVVMPSPPPGFLLPIYSNRHIHASLVENIHAKTHIRKSW
ncbi:MAG: hypothetical protein SVO26_07245, partial [Chloroflexota bacterium]|nr:hypothetical protein [Chloroflexota bacterium]